MDLYGHDLYIEQSGHESLELPEVMTLMLPDYLLKTTIQPRSIFYPCLRSLTLFGAVLDNDFVENLAQGCPVL
jgi:hypothetical protein